MRAILVGVAGAVGALARYGIGLTVGPRPFPYATLFINVTGSFVLGLVLTIATVERVSPNISVPIAVGLLGSYTTFSTFSWESFVMLRTGETLKAVLYLTASVACSLAAVAVAYRLGRAVSA